MAKSSIDIKVTVEDCIVDKVNGQVQVWFKMQVGQWDRIIPEYPEEYELLERFIEPGNIIKHTGSKVEWEIETIALDPELDFGNAFNSFNGNRVYTIKSLNSGRRKRIFTRNLHRDFSIIKAKPGFQVLYGKVK